LRKNLVGLGTASQRPQVNVRDRRKSKCVSKVVKRGKHGERGKRWRLHLVGVFQVLMGNSLADFQWAIGRM
jgi:hypothetical protein